MNKINFRSIFTAIALFCVLSAASVQAAPVKFKQVSQVLKVNSGKVGNGSSTELRLFRNFSDAGDNDNDNDKKKKDSQTPVQDGRVITETTVAIVEEEFCDCVDVFVKKKSFPYWTLGFAAVPLLFLIPRDKEKQTPTPTPTPPSSPTPTPSVTPTPTPTATPTPTPTPTPPVTPTPTPTPPEPVPEPMTILLFGTGLAGIGLAARRKFKNKEQGEN